MKKLWTLLLALALIAPAARGLAQQAPQAQQGESMGPAGPHTNPVKDRLAMRSAAKTMIFLMRVYSPKTVTTVKGSVVRLETLPPNNPTPGAVRTAVLKTEKGPETVFLVPDWFLEDHKIALKPGDQLEVVGSKINLDKGQVKGVIAKELKVGDQTLTLRDDNGVPIWLEGRINMPPAK